MSRTEEAYIYLKNGSDGEDFDPCEIEVTCLSHDGMVNHEIYMVGTPSVWVDRLVKLESGCYWVRYEVERYKEGDWESGYFDVEEAGDIVKIKKSFKALLLCLYRFYIEPTMEMVIDLFSPVWRVDYLYGGAGISQNDLWFPVAFVKRWIKVFRKPGWGEGYTEVSLRRY